MLPLQTWINDFLNLFFPNNCAACGNALQQQEQILCIKCEFKLPVTGFHQHRENPVSEVFWGRADLETATSFLFFNKGGQVQKLVHLLKYNRKKEVGLFLGKRLGIQLNDSPLYSSVDMIVPVPLHPKKQHKRGFNQSTVIALGISEATGKPVDCDNLVRLVHTDSQTKKSRYSRWENVKDVFDLQRPEEFVGKHILLIDDVLTTGATLEACADKLMEVEGVRLSAATIAYAQA
jgi:ComF family protein